LLAEHERDAFTTAAACAGDESHLAREPRLAHRSGHNPRMGWLSELVEERGAEALDLHAQTVNPQFVRLLRTIGFDRRWARAEGALKLGRAATGRPRVLSAEHAFHGLTLGALSATAAPEFTSRFGPLLPGFSQVPWGDLDALERELAAEDVALFIVEPVQGKGVNLPPPGYLAGSQELCRRCGTLFCVDEVQTGFGRTGRLLALEHWGLEPDLITVAKSLSGGYVPV